MEELIEFVLDILLEGSIEISSNKKISKWIRYPIIIFLIIFFSIVTIGMFILGIMLLEETIIGAILLITISLILLIGSIKKLKKIYYNQK